MPWFQNSRLFIRRLSVFYLFFALLAIVLLFFFLRIIPSNIADVNRHSQLLLNQIVQGLLEREKEVKGIFAPPLDSTQDQIWSRMMERDSENFAYLDNLSYQARRIKMNGRPDLFRPGKDTILNLGNSWLWHYYPFAFRDSTIMEVSLPMGNLVSPLLERPGDVFDTYFLLLDSSQTGHQQIMNIVYAQNPITSSGYLRTDTLSALQKNSDGAVPADISIAGASYKIFFCPFPLRRQHLLLAGLIDKNEYNDRIRKTPIDFIPVCIVLVLTLLIILPFIKLFTISRKEAINRTDIGVTAASFYLGTACGCLILFYALLHIINGFTFGRRLDNIANRLQASVECNISDATARLSAYDQHLSQIHSLYPSFSFCLWSPSDTGTCMRQLDSVMASLSDRHTSRVFWVDTNGLTIAKWNPSDYIAPKTEVSSYAYFTRFRDGVAQDSSGNSFVVVYGGKSNVTGEFQMFVIRKSNQKFTSQPDASGHSHSAKSYAIVEAMQMDINEHPVLPEGFGFSLTDRDGLVLVSSDPSENLRENFLEEANYDPALRDALNGRNPGANLNLPISGQTLLTQVRSINGQPLDLVVYYDQRFLSQNTVRLLLFTIQALFWLALGIVACLMISTSRKLSPTRLLFRIASVEWIRPTAANQNSYRFTVVYFGILISFYLLFYLAMALCNQDGGSLFYISLITPFFAIWAFVVARKKNYATTSENEATRATFGLGKYPSSMTNEAIRAVFRLGKYPAYFTVALNLILVFLITRTGQVGGSLAWLTAYELLAFGLLLYLSGKELSQPFSKMTWLFRDSRNYEISLIFSIILVSLLPSVGILTYAYQSEKLQYKKEKLLSYGNEMAGWLEYLNRDFLVGLKPAVRNAKGDSLSQHDLFLTAGDRVGTVPPAPDSAGSTPMPDELYRNLVNGIALAGGASSAYLVVGSASDNAEWKFSLCRQGLLGRPELRLAYQPVQTGTGILPIYSSTLLQNIVLDFIRLPGPFVLLCLLLTCLMGVIARSLVLATVRLMFLRDFIDQNWVIGSSDYLKQKLNETQPSGIKISGLTIINPLPADFFDQEWNPAPGLTSADTVLEQENRILAINQAFSQTYESIWKGLSSGEQYVLFDFCTDLYTSYKNAETFIILIQKGIVVKRNRSWSPFSLSFRQFVLSKQDGPDIRKLLTEYRTTGSWQALRTVILSLIAVIGVVVITTQTDFSRQILALAASFTALLPLLTSMLRGSSKGGQAQKGS